MLLRGVLVKELFSVVHYFLKVFAGKKLTLDPARPGRIEMGKATVPLPSIAYCKLDLHY